MIRFAYPLLLALILAAYPLLRVRHLRQSSLSHPLPGIHRQSRWSFFSLLPTILFALAWFGLCLALARPQIPEVVETRVMQTRDFVVATDISGSMWSPLLEAVPQTGGNTNGNTSTARKTLCIDAAQKAILSFVERRQGDRVALLVFDDKTYYHWPLTDDLKIILRKIELLNKNQGGGTNFDGPTRWRPGTGPIQAAINHLRDYGKAKTKVLVLVTDGLDTMDPIRSEELSQGLRNMQVHLYVLGVGSAWSKTSDIDLIRFARKLGGTVIAADNVQEVNEAFATIDAMEKSRVEQQKATNFKDVPHWFLIFSVLTLLIYLGSCALTRQDI